MEERPRKSGAAGGGVLLALAILTGTGIGFAWRQPSIGMLAGLGVGLLLAGLVAWFGRR